MLGVCYVTLVYWRWRPLAAKVLVPRATQFIVNVFGSVAFGLPANELRRSRIQVSPSLDIPDVFDVETWPVTPDLLDESMALGRPAANAQESLRRYQHLVNDEELDRRIAGDAGRHSHLSWAQLETHLPVMYDGYCRSFALENGTVPLDEAGYRREVAQIWFTLQERTRELVGAVELNHSLYYANPHVVRRIADFLASASRAEPT